MKKKDKFFFDGAKPLDTRIEEEEPRDLRGGKESLMKEAGGMTYAS
jgi:hypothetical protein